MNYMLDTNLCIYIIKKNPPEIFEKFETIAVGEISISSVTLSELTYGVAKSSFSKKNSAALEEFVLPLEILAYDESAAHHYGPIRADLERKGTPIGSLDLMIAAHARSRDITLVTHNLSEFSRIPDLKVENWIR